MKGPKEDPEDRKARLRERRMSLLEQQRTTQQTAGDLTQDFRSVYGLGGLGGLGMFGGVAKQKKGSPAFRSLLGADK